MYIKHALNIGCILVTILLMNCQNNNPSEDEEGLPTKSNIEWLTFEGKQDAEHIVLVTGDEEYRSEEALSQLAKILSRRHGFKCTVLFAQDPENPGIINSNYGSNIPGLEHLNSANLMIIFTRFRALPDEQMKSIDDYLKSGKPVIGIRTATHAFEFNQAKFETNYSHYGNSHKSEDEWDGGFGRLVLGEKWISHHGSHKNQSTKGIRVPQAINHPILNGIEDGDIWGPSDVYGVRLPLPGDSEPLVYGQVIDREGDFDKNDRLFGMRPSDHRPAKPVVRKNKGEEIKVDLNDPMMPIAWTKSYQLPGGKKGKAFTSTIGASTDMLSEGTRRLMVNATFWCLGKEVPARANVEFVDTYQPTKFAFHPDSFWIERNLKIINLK